MDGYLAVELASLELWTLSLSQGADAPTDVRYVGAIGASLAMLAKLPLRELIGESIRVEAY